MDWDGLTIVIFQPGMQPKVMKLTTQGFTKIVARGGNK
jgi:hypothetical protein